MATSYLKAVSDRIVFRTTDIDNVSLIEKVTKDKPRVI